ncbi:hypothetical protein [Streptomyces sp. NBC_00986]|uniref:hypothetical protein n=1 Tax=Streptomyces sp. NBC_00986 TaxID=2903702 RepID=UPI0038709C2D|nr:hypothetical protein OG504_15055 [Streptomyces sp. NBC_00986]
MTAGWCARTVRAAMFAAVCVLLAALAHVLMSGRHVPAWALAAGLAATGVAAWSLAGRERGLPLIVTLVVAVQAALHSAFSLAQPATAGESAAMDMGSADMGSMHMSATDSMDMGHMSATTTGTSSPGMLTAHLLAAFLCGLWLAHGERATFRVLRAVAGRLTAPLRLLLALPAPPHRPRLRPRRARSERAPRLLLLVHAITSRGPPLGTAVA